MSTAATVILVIVLLAVLFAAGWFLGGLARSRRLRNRFGPEYDRSVGSAENRRLAERELTAREKRYASLKLRPLSATARTRYLEQWAEVQERFVDAPGDSVLDADELVHSVMRDRGYPTDGFEQQAADLSVEHGKVVGHYRDGHHIRIRHERAEATTEDLRQALVHYRTIFRDLVGPAESRIAELPPTRTPGDDVDGKVDGKVDGMTDGKVDDKATADRVDGARMTTS
jgi:hypothetical protein